MPTTGHEIIYVLQVPGNKKKSLVLQLPVIGFHRGGLLYAAERSRFASNCAPQRVVPNAVLRLQHQRLSRTCKQPALGAHKQSFTAKLDPHGGSQGESLFRSIRTNTYKLHYMDTPSGIKMVLLTGPDIGDLQACLQHVYANIFVEYVVKNPLCRPGEPFNNDLFTSALKNYMKSVLD
eukprot:jgi/Mesvir1/10202/Mv18327-RA.1